MGGSVLKGPQTLFLCEEKKSVHFAAHFNLRLLTVKFVACQPQHRDIETERDRKFRITGDWVMWKFPP